MTSPAFEHIGGGTYAGGGASPNSSEGSDFNTDGTDRLLFVLCFTGRDNTSADVNEVTAISAAGLSFTRILHDVSYTYSDSVGDSGFPVASTSIDVFTAPASAQVSNASWTATMAGDGFVNFGLFYQFAVSGLNDITAPFDPNGGLPYINKNLTGTTSAPNLTGVSTTNADDTLLTFAVNHNPTSHVTPTANSGWTGMGALSATGGASGQEGFAQYMSVAAAQSSVTITAPYSDNYWYMVGFAFTGDSSGLTGEWESTEAVDTMVVTGYPGTAGVIGDLLSTEARDSFSAAGYPAAVGIWSSRETLDGFSAFIFQSVKGTWDSTEKPDTFSGEGIGFGESLTWNSSEALDIMIADGTAIQPVIGTLEVTETPDSFRALGSGATVSSKRTIFFVT